MSVVVKSRRVGGSVVITMPDGDPNLHYEVVKTLGGTYIYTPMVKRSVKPSSMDHKNASIDAFIVPDEADPRDDARTDGI